MVFSWNSNVKTLLTCYLNYCHLGTWQHYHYGAQQCNPQSDNDPSCDFKIGNSYMLTSCLIIWRWKWDAEWKKKNFLWIYLNIHRQDLFFLSCKFGVKSTQLGCRSKFTPSKLFPLTSNTKKKFRKYTSDNVVTMKTSLLWFGRPKISSYRSRSKEKKGKYKMRLLPSHEIQSQPRFHNCLSKHVQTSQALTQSKPVTSQINPK